MGVSDNIVPTTAVRALPPRRERPEPQEHRGQPRALLLLLRQPLRPRAQAPRRRGPQATQRQGAVEISVARWQSLIPSSPWTAPPASPF